MSTATNFILCIGFVLFLTFPSISQNKLRSVDESDPRYNYPNQPVTITGRELGRKSFLKEAKIWGGKSWLRELRLTVKNTSGKTLIWLYLELMVDKHGKLPTQVGIPLEFGSISVPVDANGKPQTDVVLKPFESVQLSLSEKKFEQWMKYLRGFDSEDIDYISVQIRYAHFDDGTGWAVGLETQQNPSDPNEWIVVTPSKKPGKTSAVSFRQMKWLSSLGPPNSVYGSARLFTNSRNPAEGRFLIERESTTKSEVTSTVECRWLTSQTFTNCYPGNAGQDCDPPQPGACQKPVDNTATTTNGTTRGHLNLQPTACLVANGYVGDFCSSFCAPPPRLQWFPGCGGGCNEQPDTIVYPPSGCVAPYVLMDGTCQRSQAFQERCADPTGYDPESCSCPDGTVGGSPILIDVDHSGFPLTDAAGGVDFDLFAFGFSQRVGWTAATSTNAFLVLDRNGNGFIDNGEELFGDVTPQPISSEPNGFLALAEYDKRTNGGDGNGRINRKDSIFDNLRLWQDTNHNGISESGELHQLPELGLRTIDLDYRVSRRTDEFGNRFRYRAKVRDAQDAQLGRWAWDVFFVTQPSNPLLIAR